MPKFYLIIEIINEVFLCPLTSVEMLCFRYHLAWAILYFITFLCHFYASYWDLYYINYFLAYGHRHKLSTFKGSTRWEAVVAFIKHGVFFFSFLLPLTLFWISVLYYPLDYVTEMLFLFQNYYSYHAAFACFQVLYFFWVFCIFYFS